jgi:hypothetical protein
LFGSCMVSWKLESLDITHLTTGVRTFRAVLF